MGMALYGSEYDNKMAPFFIRSVEINGDEKFREAPCTEEFLSPVILLMQISPRIPQERVR